MTNSTLITIVSNQEELEGIKDLQNACLKSNISEEEANREGFVTASYSLSFLKHMNECTPSIIAKDNNMVVGYALVCDKQSFGYHPLLDDLFQYVDQLTYNGIPLSTTNYILVGQLCVAKSHRGKGVVQMLYDSFKALYATKYTYLITDVDERNERSLKAHKKTGFCIIDTIHYGDSNWHVILWDWNQPTK